MEQPSTEKRKKLRQKQIKSSVGGTNDSSYGSMKNGASSSSSLSMSLFSESDLLEAPSTSGCSSEMAAMTQSKQKKKEKAKEFMKKLKSLLPMKERAGKMDTLATLEQVVNSMRQINEDHRRDHEFKMPPPYQGSYQTVVNDKLSKSNMYMLVSPKNHVVHSASASLMSYLGYPSDWWKGRLLKDFLNKKDINTVNSCIALHSSDEDNAGNPDPPVSHSSGTGKEKENKYVYARIRRFRKLSEGFNLHNVVSYCPFAMTISTTRPAGDVLLEDDADRLRKSLTIYCHPLTSTFSDGTCQTDETKFSMRHSPCCKFTYVHPNAVHLLGYLPQDYTEMSIFELYHPDDLPQLLDIHKKIMLSMGQPFKSKSMRLKARNSCYVEVDTEWSSFVNPWSMKLEFIIGQHSVIKGPSRPDIFEDTRPKAEKPESSTEVRKIQDKILEVLKKPTQDVFTVPATVTPAMEKASSQVPPPVAANSPAGREMVESSAKTITDTSKVRFQIQGEVPSLETKSTVIDDKGISSIYNQLNYSHNIKRFLLSHPKSFSNFSDEDSNMVMRDDCDDDAINEEEEMPLEIPVVKPPSCGSSTQVHVSEQGHGEDMLSPPTFGDDMVPAQESADNIHSLTEESLKKHTKIQERLYLQRISEEQPLLFNTRKIKNTRGSSHQKRPRPSGNDEEMESAKHPCTNSGIFRSSSNIFMQNFPAVTTADTTLTKNNTSDMFCQSELVQTQATPISIFPAPGYPSANQPGLQIPTQPITLVPGDSVGLSYIPTSLGTVVPGQGLVNVGPVRQPQNIQWPYYPQAGYTLLPQVMAGFFRPLLQPVQVQAVAPPQQGTYLTSAQGNVMMSQTSTSLSSRVGAKSGKVCNAYKNRVESDNPSSSVEDTNSSIMYLLEADSSACEDSDNKAQVVVHPPRIQKKRTVEPPWLQGVKWNAETKMRYQMPQRNLYPTLKMDNKVMKKAQQNDMVQTNLIQLLEDISLPDHEDPFDEDAEYMFFPGDQPIEAEDMRMKDFYEEVDLTTNLFEDDDGGGCTEDDGGGGDRMGMWELGPTDPDNDNCDTPMNSQSEDEKGALTPTMTDNSKEDMTTTEAAEIDNETDGKNKASFVDVVDITSVFITNQPQAEANSAKANGSQKDGSLSGDDASAGEELSTSDGGQKQETEDSQSNCSKVSSDLTRSDDRSNEEAGSSLKESDVSSKHLEGAPLMTSPNSSNEQSSPEEGMASTTLTQDYREIFKKLFVPLKVQVCCKFDAPGMPYWLVQAHLSEKVAMTYKIPTRLLEDVLSEDKKRMQDLAQSNTVKQQLLQLLSEVDSSVTTMPMATSTSVAPSCPPTSYLSSFPNPLQQVTSPSLFTTSPSAMAPPAFAKQDDQMSQTSASAPGPASILSTSAKKDNGSAEEAMCFVEERPPLFQVCSSSHGTNMSRPSGSGEEQKCSGEESSRRPECLTSDDTNSDPMVGNSLSQSSSSQGLMSDIATHQKYPVRIPASMTKTADMFFQDWCQAVATGVTGQSVEDIIMAKVFVSNDTSPNVDMKTESNTFGLLE